MPSSQYLLFSTQSCILLESLCVCRNTLGSLPFFLLDLFFGSFFLWSLDSPLMMRILMVLEIKLHDATYSYSTILGFDTMFKIYLSQIYVGYLSWCRLLNACPSWEESVLDPTSSYNVAISLGEAWGNREMRVFLLCLLTVSYRHVTKTWRPSAIGMNLPEGWDIVSLNSVLSLCPPLHLVRTGTSKTGCTECKFWSLQWVRFLLS